VTLGSMMPRSPSASRGGSVSTHSASPGRMLRESSCKATSRRAMGASAVDAADAMSGDDMPFTMRGAHRKVNPHARKTGDQPASFRCRSSDAP
jgi:hypothetical protein